MIFEIIFETVRSRSQNQPIQKKYKDPREEDFGETVTYQDVPKRNT